CGQPGLFETTRRVEVVLQKFLDSFWLVAMIDELPWKAVVKMQRMTFSTMLSIGNRQHIRPLCIHSVAIGTRQGLTRHFLYPLGRVVELVVQFDGAVVAQSCLVTQLAPRCFLLFLPRHNH